MANLEANRSINYKLFAYKSVNHSTGLQALGFTIPKKNN